MLRIFNAFRFIVNVDFVVHNTSPLRFSWYLQSPLQVVSKSNEATNRIAPPVISSRKTLRTVLQRAFNGSDLARQRTNLITNALILCSIPRGQADSVAGVKALNM
ncbi:MAG: hypothetical protein ABGX68_00055 [Methylococcales bacterium]